MGLKFENVCKRHIATDWSVVQYPINELRKEDRNGCCNTVKIVNFIGDDAIERIKKWDEFTLQFNEINFLINQKIIFVFLFCHSFLKFLKRL